VRNRWVRRNGFSSLVNGPDPELVDGSFNEAWDLADRSLAFRSGTDLPFLELFVSLLDDVAGDGAAAVKLRLVPLELHPVGVEIDYLVKMIKSFVE